ncbi:ribosome hibernation-promoting factor, HPF/YfiA family [Maribacter sp. 2210JD10-5]|uniref:ribosome hibernation-promoting factor, HPF/YfiA family n=1 Tax=Maribacter sp. 2210JD10-5 TaxID=3386272 RepID=UPI0039BC63BF
MTINIQYLHMPISGSLSKIIAKKLEKLEKKFNWILRAEVFLKLENTSLEENQICEIQLSLPGPRLFATAKSSNFEKAVVATIKELEHQLNKRKQKLTSH